MEQNNLPFLNDIVCSCFSDLLNYSKDININSIDKEMSYNENTINHCNLYARPQEDNSKIHCTEAFNYSQKEETELSKKLFQGFSTARGKTITVSNESLQKAQQLLRTIEDEMPSSDFPSSKRNEEAEVENNTKKYTNGRKRVIPQYNDHNITPLNLNDNGRYYNGQSLDHQTDRKEKYQKLITPILHGNTPFKLPSSIKDSDKIINGKRRRLVLDFPFKMPKKESISKTSSSLRISSISDELIDPISNFEENEIHSHQALTKPRFSDCHSQYGLDSSVISMTSETAVDYFPTEKRSYRLGLVMYEVELYRWGANRKLLSPEWIQNHYRWIVFKFACLERCFPSKYANRLLSFSNILKHLQHRYYREFACTHRSAIRRILERDSSPSYPFIVFVASIQDGDSHSIELSDGWYSVKAVLDKQLSKYLEQRKIFVGLKLLIFSPILYGNPTTPLENKDNLSYFKLRVNGTRRARWNAKLGFQKFSFFPLSLNSLFPDGGNVSLVKVSILKQYPFLFLERGEDNKYYARNAKAEAAAVSFQQEKMLELAELNQKRFQNKYFTNSDTIEEVCSQNDIEVNTEADNIPSKFEHNKKIVLLKLKLQDLYKTSNSQIDCILSIWGATEDTAERFAEGLCFDFYNLSSPPSYSSSLSQEQKELRLSCNSSSLIYKELKNIKVPLKKRIPISFSELNTLSINSEFDCIAYSVFVSEPYETVLRSKPAISRNIFLTSASNEILVINVSESEYRLLLPPYIDEGTMKVLIALNIKYCGFDKKFSLFNAVATDMSSFHYTLPPNSPFSYSESFQSLTESLNNNHHFQLQREICMNIVYQKIEREEPSNKINTVHSYYADSSISPGIKKAICSTRTKSLETTSFGKYKSSQ